jgi:hypothetical protein
MKKNSKISDELRPEYDMKQLLEGAVRGKYAKGTNLVLLSPDVADAFPNAEAVNEALRLVLRLSQIPAASDKEPIAF